jgi:hypothetical protein
MDGVESVFISSVQEGFERVRHSARWAVENLGLRPIMAEQAGAWPNSPRSALLSLVRDADAFLLILGRHYSRPTEDEFDEARRAGKPIFVLKQNVSLEPAQDDFLERVAVGWERGRLWDTFTDESDVGDAVVRALSGQLRRATRAEDLAPAARTRAGELAAGEGGARFGRGGSIARVAFVPLGGGVLLDAVALEDPDLGDTIADLARSARLVPHHTGISPVVSRAGVDLQRSETRSYGGQSGPVVVGADGAVTAEVDVAGADQWGSSRVDPDRLREGIRRTGRFALGVWERIDPRDEVQRVAVAVGIPEAQQKRFGPPTHSGSFTMGSSVPPVVVAPEEAVVVRRGEVASDELVRRLVAEVRRVFADAGAADR